MKSYQLLTMVDSFSALDISIWMASTNISSGRHIIIFYRGVRGNTCFPALLGIMRCTAKPDNGGGVTCLRRRTFLLAFIAVNTPPWRHTIAPLFAPSSPLCLRILQNVRSSAPPLSPSRRGAIVFIAIRFTRTLRCLACRYVYLCRLLFLVPLCVCLRLAMVWLVGGVGATMRALGKWAFASLSASPVLLTSAACGQAPQRAAWARASRRRVVARAASDPDDA